MQVKLRWDGTITAGVALLLDGIFIEKKIIFFPIYFCQKCLFLGDKTFEFKHFQSRVFG